MNEVKPNLGWALAHLQTANTEISRKIPQDHLNYLEQVTNRLKVLNSDGKLIEILESLPDKGCTVDNPFLENNEDYFIALFSNTKYDKACIRLYNHLNNCYHCFEIFSQVLRDYYRNKPQTDKFYREKTNDE
jgi:hypothetical protein